MVKANELRVGNLLRYISEKDTDLGYRSVTANDIVHISKNICMYKPIKITHDIMFKSGFYKSADEYIIRVYKCDPLEYSNVINEKRGLLNFIICQPRPTDDLFLYVNIGNYTHALSAQIKYVHELQNIYYAITNSELEVKL